MNKRATGHLLRAGGDIATERHCSTCRQVKPIAAFNRNRVAVLGTQLNCRDCQAIEHRAWRENHTALDRAWWTLTGKLSRYGVTLDQFHAKYEAQDFCCGICGDELIGPRGIHIDHCHETDAFRGLLCHTCNVGLGMFKDDTSRLSSAIQYLQP